MIKFFNQRRQKGQSTLEYAILIIIVLAALLAIQNYVKRGYQGRLKSATDQIGDQFSPGNTNVNKTTRTQSFIADNYVAGQKEEILLNDEVTTTRENSTIINQEFEYWGK